MILNDRDKIREEISYHFYPCFQVGRMMLFFIVQFNGNQPKASIVVFNGTLR